MKKKLHSHLKKIKVHIPKSKSPELKIEEKKDLIKEAKLENEKPKEEKRESPELNKENFQEQKLEEFREKIFSEDIGFAAPVIVETEQDNSAMNLTQIIEETPIEKKEDTLHVERTGYITNTQPEDSYQLSKTYTPGSKYSSKESSSSRESGIIRTDAFALEEPRNKLGLNFGFQENQTSWSEKENRYEKHLEPETETHFGRKKRKTEIF